MKKHLVLILSISLLLASCQSQSVDAPAATPIESPLPTATLAPTETSLPDPTETPLPLTEMDPSLFGSVSTADAPAGFMLEPIAQIIFEAEMQKRVDAGEITAFQVESMSIVPRGDGTFFAEIFYALQADASFWAEDFGTPGDEGWVRGKCTRFDFEITEDAYFLKNKAVCS
jgi:hypothetical protein